MKKLLATLLASAMALATVGGLVACGGDGETKDPVKATGLTFTDLYGNPITSATVAPDGSVGVLAKLAPAGATSTITWTSSNEGLLTAKPGAAQNTQALLYGLDSGDVTVTAEVDGVKVTLPVTVTDWTRFMLVGTINSWNPEDATEQWLFKQDATDKHLWTADVELDANAMIKVVAAAKNEEGKVAGLGWNGGYNLGIDNQNPDVPEEGKEDTPEQAAARKKQVVEGKKGVLNIVNDGGSGNIVLGEDGVAGTYKFTLKTKPGGAFDSLSYEFVEAAE